VHEKEWSGLSWALAWAIHPDMLPACASSLAQGSALLRALTPNEGRLF